MYRVLLFNKKIGDMLNLLFLYNYFLLLFLLFYYIIKTLYFYLLTLEILLLDISGIHIKE